MKEFTPIQAPIAPVLQDQVIDAYESHFIESSLRAYLDAGTTETEIKREHEVSALLMNFSEDLANLAYHDRHIDTDIIRYGFDHLTNSMNGLCRETLQQTATGLKGFLAKIGLVSAPHRPDTTYIRKLDDRYWNEQFLKIYEDNPFVPRKPDETDQEYLARHIHNAMFGFLYAPFTYVK